MREEFLKKVAKTITENELKVKVYKDELKSGIEDAGDRKFIENEIERLETPFSRGYLLGYHCVLRNDGLPILDTVLFDNEVSDFVKAIEDAGFKEFVMTDQSSGLLDIMCALELKGWVFKCLGGVYKNTSSGIKRFSAMTFRRA